MRAVASGASARNLRSRWIAATARVGVIAFTAVGTLALTSGIASATPPLNFSWGLSSTEFDLGASPVTLAPATTNSEGAVTYEVLPDGNSAHCSLESSSAPVVLSFTSAGECSVSATLAASDPYGPDGPLTNDFTIRDDGGGGGGPASQTISFTAPESGTYADFDVLAPTASSGLDVTLSVDEATTNGSCSLTGFTVHYLHVGTCVIDANQEGNEGYTAAEQVQRTIVVGPASQSITFSAPESGTVGGSDNLGPTASSELSVTLTVDEATTNNACSLDGDVVLYDHAGNCVLDANQPGTGDVAAAEQSHRTIVVGPASQSITFIAPESGTVGGSDDLGPTATSGLAVQPSVDGATTNDACTLDGATVHYLHVGNCVLDADQVGNGDFDAAGRVQRTVVVGPAPATDTPVSPAPQVLTFTTLSVTPRVGESYAPGATATSGLGVTFSVDPGSTAICTMSGGVVRFLSAGNCVLNADQSGNGAYSPASRIVQTLAVGKGTQMIHFTTMARSPRVGGTYTPRASGGASGNRVTFSVDRSSAVRCSISRGIVHFTAVGKCLLDAHQAGNARYDAAVLAEQRITVAKGLPASLTLTYANDSPALSAAAKTQLRQFAATIRARGLTIVDLAGYASSTGLAKRNQMLSAARAAVAATFLRSVLVASGVKVTGITLNSVGRGATSFVVSPPTAAANRRVEIIAR